MEHLTIYEKLKHYDDTEEIVEEMQKEREEDRETIKWLKEEVMVLKKQKEMDKKLDKLKR